MCIYILKSVDLQMFNFNGFLIDYLFMEGTFLKMTFNSDTKFYSSFGYVFKQIMSFHRLYLYYHIYKVG